MKKIEAKIIKSSDLIKNSSGKLGRHIAEVRTGTGIHKSKKQYNRKSKDNQRLNKELKSYRNLVAYFFCPKVAFNIFIKGLDVSIIYRIQYPL